MSNMLFLCQYPLDQQETLRSGEPDKTLLRVYFNPETESHLVAESVIFTLLSERQLGPRLFGIFNGGRLEEYIVSRPLTCPDIRQDDISLRIARKIARIHKLNVPISKEPTYLCEALERWIERLRLCSPSFSLPINTTIDKISNGTNFKVRVVDLDELQAHLYTIKSAISRSTSPVVFCHNDLQEGNILLPKENCDKDLVVIDFEYASYNYRAFDFANHFCEWSISYGHDESPHYEIDMENFPSHEAQKRFIREYLKENVDNSKTSSQNFLTAPVVQQLINNDPLSDENLENIRLETEAFVPVSHFFWGVWSLLQVELSPVKFGFSEYAKDRLSLYFQLRPNLIRLISKKNSSSLEPMSPAIQRRHTMSQYDEKLTNSIAIRHNDEINKAGISFKFENAEI
uniref:Choline kinase n=1 Tax=Romanomermis culicivorax TaxID=13658 RepID=A0A915L771_ROMCU